MKRLFWGCLFVVLLVFTPVWAQEHTGSQGADVGQEKAIIRPVQTALAAYTKWRAELLPKYLQLEQTPHYAIAMVSQRLDDNTAQVEMLVAADMKHYTITIRPVMLAKQVSGEVTTTPAGKAVAIDQKAGRKLTAGTDQIRIGEMTATVPVSKAVQALEITWSPSQHGLVTRWEKARGGWSERIGKSMGHPL